MTARQIDDAAARLRELRIDAAANLALAGIAFGLAVAASLLLQPVAVPLLLGGIGATVLGMRAFLRRCFLVEDLAEDKDAHVIADVRRYAARISVFPDAGTNRDHAHSPAWEEPGTKARRRPRA